MSKLEIGDSEFFGISSGSNPTPRKIALRVNPISKTHAEADATQQKTLRRKSDEFQDGDLTYWRVSW